MPVIWTCPSGACPPKAASQFSVIYVQKVRHISLPFTVFRMMCASGQWLGLPSLWAHTVPVVPEPEFILFLEAEVDAQCAV